MQEIIITILILGAGYYLLIHKKQPVLNEPINDNQELEKTLDNLITNIKNLNHSLK
jgi:Tfp pilus assembly protein PilO